MKFKFILLLVLFGVARVYAQQIDSLRQFVSLKGLDQADSQDLIRLGEEYLNIDVDSAFFFAKQVLKRKRLTADEELRAVLIKAKVYYRKDSLQQARFELFNINGIIENVKDVYFVQNYRMIRAYISDLNTDFKDAVLQNQLGLTLSEALNDTVYSARFHNNLGITYKAIGQFKDAVAHFKIAAQFFAYLNETQNEASAFLNLGATYVELANYDSAYAYFEKSKTIFKKGRMYYELASYYGNAANVSMLQGNYKAAVFLLHTKLAYLDSASTQSTRPLIISKLQAFEDLARSYESLQNHDDALYYYRLIYELAKPQNLPEFLSVSSKGLSSIYEKKNWLDSSLFYAKEFILWSDSIVQRQNRESAFQLKSDYELKLALAERQKNQEAIVAQKERWLLIYGLIILALVTILVAVYAAFQRAVKKQKEKQVVELQLQAEKKKLEGDLVMRDKELIANQIMLSETENRIESTLKEIKEAIVEPTSDRNTVLQKIAKQIEGKSGRKAISALDGYLQESDKRLFEALSKLHPDLTRAELRICAFIRLNLSTKEIAAISHQTSNSIKIARYRLRRKLKLGANENLVSYLNRIVSSFA